jgi:N-acetylmuramoyl-L-alanine amidase
MARHTDRSSSRRSHAVRREARPAASSSQLIALAVIGFAGALILFVLSGAIVTRNGSTNGERQIVIEQSDQARSLPTPASTDGLALAPFQAAISPPPRSTAERPAGPYVGIVAGHWGNDSGAVCPDGVTEQQVNLAIAKRVTERLRARGVWVDLLQEFDSRLTGFSGDLLVSIHADSCDPIDADPPATGFKVARSQASQIPTIADKLVGCLHTEYQQATGLALHENSITNDMTFYHSFNELDPNTPAAIIETGFLRLDYDMIVKQPDRPAAGIAAGILCFLKTQL